MQVMDKYIGEVKGGKEYFWHLRDDIFSVEEV
ncbi:MAG: hypothetical protein BTN85_0124 [Candidatus Methanohalarchaeum thermophilum]|uniref:Uncharacterized protein n=1 Tax=Methanohalarchaeum thermophilum TaxID=1903181 RepID=A0A1Q6DTH7_METT1|nr:MAG: hypothetical protein BTN85_0124 [Candidatus Methanohalarchaeum thermophilum]